MAGSSRRHTYVSMGRKLKNVKTSIKKWRKISFDNPGVKLRNKLKVIHDNLGTDPANVFCQKEELHLQDEIGKWLGHQEDQWKQKSRETWMHLGDKNNKFFYSVVETRQARNHISHLKTEEEKTVTDLDSIKVSAPVF